MMAFFENQTSEYFFVAMGSNSFLVGAFSLKEKSPALTVSSFFLFFQLTISL